jgi:hypothetical protein
LSQTARGALEATARGPGASHYRLGRRCTERSATRYLLIFFSIFFPFYLVPLCKGSKGGWIKLTRHSAQQTQRYEAARLYNAPTSTFTDSHDTSYAFETAAVAIAGADEGTWYGSVTWAFKYARGAGVTLSDFEVRAQAGTSDEFANLVSIWNSGYFSPEGWDHFKNVYLTLTPSVKLPPVQTTS